LNKNLFQNLLTEVIILPFLEKCYSSEIAHKLLVYVKSQGYFGDSQSPFWLQTAERGCVLWATRGNWEQPYVGLGEAHR